MRALIERDQLQRPFVIGHSMGGKTAMALALSHPQTIGGIAVIDIAPESYADQFSSYVSAMRSLDMASATSRREIREALAGSLSAEAPVDFLMQNLRRQNANASMPANFLKRQALPSMTGLPARAPMLRRPSTAVPLATSSSTRTTPTR
ncbi:esterase YbfF [Variovorax paradoxus]|uniref:Esterase YbfF n=1 Tax=Variovorax paradoxus TaxID=34073 RepID=A0A0H2LW45_VARPD|nr:esterase YbfF [Variovorax paradoxus]